MMKRATCTHALNSCTRMLGMAALALCLLTGVAGAQQVYWMQQGPLDVGRRSGLELVFDETEPASTVSLPRIDGLTVLGEPSRGTSISTVNGRYSARHTLYFPVRAERQGDIEVPSFEVRTRHGNLKVDSMTLHVGQAAARNAGRGNPQGNAVVARMALTDTHPYAGEVFDVEMTVELANSGRGALVGQPTWDKGAIVAEPWSAAQPIQGGSGARMHTRAIVPTPGTIDVPAVHQEVQIETGRTKVNPFAALGSASIDSLFDRDAFFNSDSFFDDIFSRPQMTSTTATSNTSAMTVRPLPEPAPQGFTGAVGSFTLESKMVPEQPKAGEPVTWTLTLRGTGNWPGGVALPARAIPNDFRALQPKQKREFAENNLFTGSVSEDLVLVPNTPGEYRLDPVRFTYFDPRMKQYQTAEVSPPVMHVGGVAVTTGAAPTGAPRAANETDTIKTAPAPAPPHSQLSEADTGSRLPRDPIAGSASAASPVPVRRVLAVASVPVAALGIYLLLLALRRARVNDPQRPRREAVRGLAAAIEQTGRAAGAAERRHALRAWQQAAAVVLRLDVAAPTPAHLQAQPHDGNAWIELWSDSDRALYAEDAPLPTNWCQRAKAASRGLRLPRLNPLRAFLPENLVPRAAAAALLVFLFTASLQAATLDAYQSGDFAAAREELRAQVETDPSDWVARYNLGLAEAQLGAAGRALGETFAALVHAPRDEAVRWNASVFAERVPSADHDLARFARGEGGVALARVLSPAHWQAALVAGACLLCVGGALVVRRRHHPSKARGRSFAMLLLGGGLAAGVAALVCLHQYGRLASPGAALVAEQVMLRSVPTDAASPQQQRPVAPGTVVVADKDFLGWTQVTLATGETGWLRHGDLVPFYAAPRA